MADRARLLDLSRLAGRASRVLTGVDRVERAYLRAMIADPAPVFGLVRTALGWLLLDRRAMAAFDRAIDTQDWGKARLIDRLARRRDAGHAAVEGFLRRHAMARAARPGLGRLLRRLPGPPAYVNVGQTSLRPAVFAAIRALRGARIAVMIHDTIPLDHPEWQRPGAPARFAAALALVRDQADLVIANSHAVAGDCRRHMGPDAPPVITAHLGVDLAAPDPAALPDDLDLSRPWFVALNTIEPRKNHALLLDAWEELARRGAAPTLFVIGSRGWANAAVFSRLDARPPGVVELGGLSDGAVAALIAGARAVLNPSLAEGFGLPGLEAAGRGAPLLCGDLAIWRELLGDWPVYLDLRDSYQWAEAIERLARAELTADRKPVAAPGWADHFKIVLSAL